MFKLFNFNDIGNKIKKIAEIYFKVMTVLYWIAAVVFIIVAIVEDWGIWLLIALGSALLGPVLAWFSAVPLYGFGELITKTTEVARNTRGGEAKSEAQNMKDDERIAELEKLRAEGLITEEEYKEKIKGE